MEKAVDNALLSMATQMRFSLHDLADVIRRLDVDSRRLRMSREVRDDVVDSPFKGVDRSTIARGVPAVDVASWQGTTVGDDTVIDTRPAPTGMPGPGTRSSR